MKLKKIIYIVLSVSVLALGTVYAGENLILKKKSHRKTVAEKNKAAKESHKKALAAQQKKEDDARAAQKARRAQAKKKRNATVESVAQKKTETVPSKRIQVAEQKKKNQSARTKSTAERSGVKTAPKTLLKGASASAKAQALIDTYARQSKGQLSELYLKKSKALVKSYLGPVDTHLHKNGDKHLIRVETQLAVLEHLLRSKGVAVNTSGTGLPNISFDALTRESREHAKLFEGLTVSDKRGVTR